MAIAHEPVVAYTLGPELQEFEAAFAALCGVEHCVGVSSGTDAVKLALLSAGVGPGDEVAVPANTFIATAEAHHERPVRRERRRARRRRPSAGSRG